jgi:hypothetical protein
MESEWFIYLSDSSCKIEAAIVVGVIFLLGLIGGYLIDCIKNGGKNDRQKKEGEANETN